MNEQPLSEERIREIVQEEIQRFFESWLQQRRETILLTLQTQVK